MNIPIKRATTKEKSEFDLQKINNAEERKTKLIAAIFVKHKTKIKQQKQNYDDKKFSSTIPFLRDQKICVRDNSKCCIVLLGVERCRGVVTKTHILIFLYKSAKQNKNPGRTDENKLIIFLVVIKQN